MDYLSKFFLALAALMVAEGRAADRGAPPSPERSVSAKGRVVSTPASGGIAEAALPGRGVLRLAGVSRARTGASIQLEQGQGLLSSGKGIVGRRGLESEIGPVVLSLRGTALVSALAGQPVKITVLEGAATARLKERRSHFVELRAGAMLMVGMADREMPVPTEVRLATLRTTSGLLGDPFGLLPSEAALAAAVARQERELEKRRLIVSTVRVQGARASFGGQSAEDGSRTAGGGPSTSGGASTGGSASSTAGGAGGGATGAAGGLFCVGCASHATPVGAVTASDPNRLAQIRAENEAVLSGGGRVGPAVPGGKVSPAVTVSNVGSRGDLGQLPDPATSVMVTNSTDLNALAQALILASFGENILIADSAFTRQPGTINVDAGSIFERTLTLRQSTLTADVIKARSFQTGNRDALVVEGGAFHAGQLIRLYAEGAGTLRFRGEVTLGSPISEIAGRVVQIDAGGLVRASGAVGVFADEHRYDQPGFGSLEAAGAKTAQPFASRPRY